MNAQINENANTILTTLANFGENGAKLKELTKESALSQKDVKAATKYLLDNEEITKDGSTFKTVEHPRALDDDAKAQAEDTESETESVVEVKTTSTVTTPPASTKEKKRKATSGDALKITSAGFDGQDAVVAAIESLPEDIRHAAIEKALKKSTGGLQSFLAEQLPKYPAPVRTRFASIGKNQHVVNYRQRAVVLVTEEFCPAGDFVRVSYDEIDGEKVCVLRSVKRSEVTEESYSPKALQPKD